MGGPIPKRSDKRTRRNKENSSGIALKKGEARGILYWPEANPEWAEPVQELYNGFRNSGMANFYEQSDVAMALIACDTIDAFYRGGKRNANMIATGLQQAAALGATEAERRRMAIELDLADEGAEEEAEVLKIVDFRDQAMGKEA